MEKTTISMAIFNSYVKLPKGMTEDQILEGKQKSMESPTQTCRPSCSEQPSSKPVSKWASTEGPQSPRVPNGVPNGGPLVIRWNQRPSWHFEESEDLNAPKRPQRNQKSTSEVSLHFCLEVSRLCTVLMKSWPGGPGGPPGHEDLLQPTRNDHRMPRRQRPNTTHRWPPPGYDDPNFCRWSRCNCPAPRISAESWDFSWWFLREVGLGKNWDQ